MKQRAEKRLKSEKDKQRKTALSEKQGKLQIHLKTIEQALC